MAKSTPASPELEKVAEERQWVTRWLRGEEYCAILKQAENMDRQLETWLEDHGIYVRSSIDIREVCFDMDQHKEDGCLLLDKSHLRTSAESNTAQESVGGDAIQSAGDTPTVIPETRRRRHHHAVYRLGNQSGDIVFVPTLAGPRSKGVPLIGYRHQGVYFRSQRSREANYPADSAVFSVHIVKLVRQIQEASSKTVQILKIERGISGTEINGREACTVKSEDGGERRTQMGDYTIVHTQDDHPFKSRSIVTLKDCSPKIDGDWKVYSKISSRAFSLKHKLHADFLEIDESSNPLAVSQYRMDDNVPRIYHIQRNQSYSDAHLRIDSVSQISQGARRRLRELSISESARSSLLGSSVGPNHIRARLYPPLLTSRTITACEPFQSHFSSHQHPSFAPSTASISTVQFNALQHGSQQADQPSYLLSLPHIQNSSILAQSYMSQIPTPQTSHPLSFPSSITAYTQPHQQPHTSSSHALRMHEQYGSILNHQPQTVQRLAHHSLYPQQQQAQPTSQVHHADQFQSYGAQQSTTFGGLGGLTGGGALNPHFSGIIQIPTSAVGQPSFSNQFTIGTSGDGGSNNNSNNNRGENATRDVAYDTHGQRHTL